MKKTILFLVVLAFYNTICAQNKNMSNNSSANSYEQELLLFENGRYSDIHRDTIIKYGRVLRDSAKLYEEVDVAKSITYELKYLSMQRKYGIDPDTLTTFTNLGKYYKENEDYANAQLYFNKALTLAESLFPASEQRHVELYIQLASLYGRIQEPENAFAYSEKARVIESKINGSETETYATIVMNSALYKFMSGDVTYCLNQLKQVYQHPKCKKINVAINLAGVYSDQGDADSCYKYVAEAWDMIREEVVFNIENLTIEDRFKYFTTEKTYSLITSPINYFLQHEGHKGLLRLAYNCILFYKKTGMAITNNNNNEIEKTISFDTIKGLLKENEIAIELWSDISGSWYSDYILAFVVSPNEKDPVFVKLPKDSIYMALNNELEASKTFLPLYETMWKNLINSIVLKRHGKIYISCDDIYTLIPFESICNYDFEYLGDVYSIIRVSYTGNIKNVKSVVVPNTGGRCGIEAAAAIGALGGDENAQLQVIAGITDAVTEGKRARQLSLPRPCGLSSRSGKTGSRFGYIYSAWSASHASSCLWFSSMILFIPAASSASRNFGSMDSASTVPTLSAGPYFPISAMTAVISEDTLLVSKL